MEKQTFQNVTQRLIGTSTNFTKNGRRIKNLGTARSTMKVVNTELLAIREYQNALAGNKCLTKRFKY